MGGVCHNNERRLVSSPQSLNDIRFDDANSAIISDSPTIPSVGGGGKRREDATDAVIDRRWVGKKELRWLSVDSPELSKNDGREYIS